MEITKIRVADVEYKFRDETTLKDAPADGREYVRKDGEWKASDPLTPEQKDTIAAVADKADKTEVEALRAEVAGKADEAAVVTLSGEQTIKGAKTFSGGVDMNGTSIRKLATPLNSDDAANKSYVDALQTRIAQLEAIINEITTKE